MTRLFGVFDESPYLVILILKSFGPKLKSEGSQDLPLKRLAQLVVVAKRKAKIPYFKST